MDDNGQQHAPPRYALVTGGAGFIGSHLVRHLLTQGVVVTVLDSLASSSYETWAEVEEHVKLHIIDLRHVSWEQFLVQQPYDVIFHLAGNAYVPPSVTDPAADYQLNFEVTLRLLEALRKTKWQGVLINASSAAVYGNALRFPIHEDDPTRPISPYGVAKLATERYVAVYSSLYSVRAASLRFFSAYGPGQRKQVVYDLIERISNCPPQLFIHGDGTQARDLLFVEDAAQAATLVVERGALHGEVYNVGSGRETTINELATRLCSIIDVQLPFAFSGVVRPGDPERLAVDITRLGALGYRPRVSLEEGLRRTVAWYQQRASRACS